MPLYHCRRKIVICNHSFASYLESSRSYSPRGVFPFRLTIPETAAPHSGRARRAFSSGSAWYITCIWYSCMGFALPIDDPAANNPALLAFIRSHFW